MELLALAFQSFSAAFGATLAATQGTDGAPLWTLEGLRRADPLFGIALLVIVAVVVGEAVGRWTRLPRSCGHMLVGVAASPLALRLLERTDLDPWKPLLDLAIGVLVFELGSRIRPRWLIDNPMLALQCVAEGLCAGLAVWGLLVWLGVPSLSAAFAGAVAIATSPVIVMVGIHECHSRGQVTERLLMMTAVNGVIAVLALKSWRVFALAKDPLATEWIAALTNAIVVLMGSFLLGVALGLLLTWLSKPMRRTSASAVLQIGLLVITALLAAQWALSPLLALLVGGVVARDRMGHSLTVEPQLGTAGAALTVLLFVSIGLLGTVEDITKLWPWVLAIVLGRAAGKALAVVALAKPSGLGMQQSLALSAALQPMAASALLLSATTFGWPADTPQLHTGVLQALWIATTLMQLSGPVWIALALRRVVREATPG